MSQSIDERFPVCPKPEGALRDPSTGRAWTREDLEDMKMSELRELTDAKSVKREDLIQAILRTPDAEQPEKPQVEPRPDVPYELIAPDRWIPPKEWLDQMANQYAVEKFVWVDKFRAFQVWVGGRHADWITWEQLHKLFGNPVPRLRRSRMPQRPLRKNRIIKHID